MVFTTTMVGYQEVCTDPSFRGQIVCMTYPLIGNYGIHAEDNESRQPWIAGLVVREHSVKPSHSGSTGTIQEYLERHRIPAISGVDTRSLTLHIRQVGDTRGVIVRNATEVSDAELIARARQSPLPGEYDVVGEVTAPNPEIIDGPGPHIVVLDCGVKRNIIRSLVKRGARLTIVPLAPLWTRFWIFNRTGWSFRPDRVTRPISTPACRLSLACYSSRFPTSASAWVISCWPGRSALRQEN